MFDFLHTLVLISVTMPRARDIPVNKTESLVSVTSCLEVHEWTVTRQSAAKRGVVLGVMSSRACVPLCTETYSPGDTRESF